MGPSTYLLKGSMTVPFKTTSGYLAITPDGKWVACGSWSLEKRTVYIWNSETGRCKLKLKSSHYVWSVAFSPDGKKLALTSANGTIEVYDWPPTHTTSG